MKIIISLHHFLPEYVGGTEIYTLRLAQQLKYSGNNVTILVPNFDSPLNIEYEYEGIRVIKYAENSIEDRLMIMGKKEPVGLNAFAEILNFEKPDIMHFHELAPGRGVNIFHVKRTRKLNIPIILTFHLGSYSCFKGSFIYKDGIKCDGIIKIKKCTECVYHSKNITGVKGQLLNIMALGFFYAGINPTKMNNTIGTALGFPYVISKIKDDLLQLSALAEKIVVIADWYKNILEKNGVPSSKLVCIKQGLTSEINNTNNFSGLIYPLKVVFIGRITALKGLHLLIDAISAVPENTISLFIYGKEIQDSYCMDCRQKSSAKKNIHWMGVIPSGEVVPTLSNYHILCLPSAYEMSPLVIQEAFASGLPVLASDVYGNAEQIQDGVNGWLFRYNDSLHLADKLKMLIGDVKLVESARSHLPAGRMFSEIAGEHLSLYTQIIRDKTKAVQE